jgi:large subunit GTPase 1
LSIGDEKICSCFPFVFAVRVLRSCVLLPPPFVLTVCFSVVSLLARQASDIDELMTNAQLSGREFEVEHERAVVLDKRVYLAHVQDTPPQHRLGVMGTAKGEAGASLPIPLRPAWHRGMKADELHVRERESFLNWRRTLVKLEEESGVLLTPYEKNLEVWRQLWRVVERSDVVLQIVDARNPLLFYCPSLDEYVKHTPRVMGEPTTSAAAPSDPTHTLLVINKSDFLSLEQRYGRRFRTTKSRVEKGERESESERKRERVRGRKRERERQRSREKVRERHTHTEKEKERERERKRKEKEKERRRRRKLKRGSEKAADQLFLL